MKLTVKEVAMAKGYKNAKALTEAMSEHFGVRLSYSTIYPYWDDTAERFDRTTLDRLCRFLNVPVGLILQFIDEADLSLPPVAQAGFKKPNTVKDAGAQRSRSKRRVQKAMALTAGM